MRAADNQGRDRPVGTKAMIDAGVRALGPYLSERCDYPGEIVSEVWAAMQRVAHADDPKESHTASR